MDVDAELMFECLIYLNMFYFPVFALCETIMTIAKYRSIIKTPHIGQDAAVVFTRLTSELTKILLYRKFKEEKRQLVTGIAVFFTYITISGLAYTFFIQKPVLKLEHILNSLTIMLALSEVVFGNLQLMLKCFRRNPYY
ncbi:transmembrane protein 216-like [Euwallacea similis]|uniref:transmembrane protein 216-like n=1 Tax=Euwallacea similis TaxID=1736056 RepID=UPI00344CE0E1